MRVNVCYDDTFKRRFSLTLLYDQLSNWYFWPKMLLLLLQRNKLNILSKKYHFLGISLIISSGLLYWNDRPTNTFENNINSFLDAARESHSFQMGRMRILHRVYSSIFYWLVIKTNYFQQRKNLGCEEIVKAWDKTYS